MKTEQTEYSETSAYKIQTPGNYPEGSIQHSEHGESLKSRISVSLYLLLFNSGMMKNWWPGVAEWLRHRATSRTVPGSIPGGVTGFFNDIFPSDHTMALGSTQPLVKMSTRNISWG